MNKFFASGFFSLLILESLGAPVWALNLDIGRAPLEVAPAVALGAAVAAPILDAPALDMLPFSAVSAANDDQTQAAEEFPAAPSQGKDDEKVSMALGQEFDNSRLGKGVSEDWVADRIAQSQSADALGRQLRNVVQTQGFRAAALNREVIEKHNDQYTVKIPMGPITNQASSGRCWMFAGFNMLRSTLIAEGRVPKDFEFSENFLHFFNMLEKSNKHIEDSIGVLYRRRVKNPLKSLDRRWAITPEIGDGGWYEYFSFLVSKYGLVPKGAMGETISSENTKVLIAELEKSLAETMAELTANARQFKAGDEINRSADIRQRGMNRVWNILATHLGVPPASFEYREAEKARKVRGIEVIPTKIRKFTPKQFAQDFVKFDPRDYVVVSAWPGKRLNKTYQIKKSAIGTQRPGDSNFDVRFMNVSPRRMLELTVAAIRKGQPVWFAADVLHDVDYKTGIMHPNIFNGEPFYQHAPADRSPELTHKQKAYFQIVQANHAMVLTALDQPDPNGPIVKFLVENSWSKEVGDGGKFHMYTPWLLENVREIIVHKKNLSAAERKRWEGKAMRTTDASLY